MMATETKRERMTYLSVHDLVWIHETATGTSVPYNYERLEAAMGAQYSYGQCTDPLTPSAFLFEKLAYGQPFRYGNHRTAFIATAVFLIANGYRIKCSDEELIAAFQRALSRQLSPIELVCECSEKENDGMQFGGELMSHPTMFALTEPFSRRQAQAALLRGLVTDFCTEHREALGALAAEDGP